MLFINDLPDGIKNISKLFADDLKLIADARKGAEVREDLSQLEHCESLWLQYSISTPKSVKLCT